MANKIYVGEEGAKELYRKIKALIPGAVTVVDEVSLNSMDAVTSHAVAVAVGNLTGFLPVDGTGADNHPDVNTPNTRTIYLVKIPEIVGEDKYKEWIWVIPEQGAGSWECIGSTSIPENAWKQWSEDNGSSGVGDSVYLGKNNTLTRNDTYALGKGNTATITDATDYSNTDVVMLGTSNSATNAANAYQIGRENTITGNNLANKLTYPHSMAVNMGRNNAITGEGVNIGKDNVATTFGINIGQNNTAANASCAIGQLVNTDDASIAMGNGRLASQIPTVYGVPSLLVDNKYEHVEQFKVNKSYELYDYAVVAKNPDSNQYEWAHVQDTFVEIYPNFELGQYLVSWGSASYSGTRYIGYFDENGQFVSSDDPSKDIHEYVLMTTVGNRSGSDRVQVQFLTNLANAQSHSPTTFVYMFRIGDTNIPTYGTILNQAEYDTFTNTAVKVKSVNHKISNLFVDPSDLTADAYTVNALSANTELPFVLTYKVYGYKDNGVLIPYNEQTKDSDNTFDWYEVNASDLTEQPLPLDQVQPDATPLAAINKSAIFGVGCLQAKRRSLILATNDNGYELKYNNTDSTYVYRTYSNQNNRKYTIDQENGSYNSTSMASFSIFTCENVTDYTNYVSPAGASADNGSMVLSTGKASADGGSIAIGEITTAAEKGYTFGAYTTARNNAVSIGNSASSSGSSIAIGINSASATNASIAFGQNGVSSTNSSLSIGFYGISASDNSMAFGFSGSATKQGMIVGYSNFASEDGIAFGRYNNAYKEAISIGVSNTMYYQNLALGFNNYMQDNTDDTVHTALIGRSNMSGPGGYNIGIGEFNTSSHEAISIGRNNQAYGWSIALGVRNRSAYVKGGHATLIGFNNVSSSTLEQIKKPTYGLIYGIPLNIQQSIKNYYQAFWNKYSDYVEDHIENLSGMKDDITSAYNLMDTYITDSDLDTAYNELMAISTISDLYSTIYQSKFSQYWYEIIYALDSSTPGMVAGDPITYANNSIIMGTGNTSNHYNSILLGIGNTSLAPAEELEETDDDGFTVAIGFKNTVERNYDMAIGYQSVAKGGENIAITNSEAVGYRNLAYNHSIVHGICNTALNESTLQCTQYDNTELPNKFNVFNTLLHSAITYHNRYEQQSQEYPHTGVAISSNHFENTKCNFSSAWGGASANFVFGNGDIASQYAIPVNISAESISDNIIALPTQEFNMQLCNCGWNDCSVSRNIMLLDDKINLTDFRLWVNNIALLSNIQVQMDEQYQTNGKFHKNIFIDSNVCVRNAVYTGAKANVIANNIVCNDSYLYLGSTTGTISHNILLSEAKLEANSTNTVWANDSAGNNHNFLVGSTAKQVTDCVSFGDGKDAYLENAMHSRNFGDNTLTNTNKVFVAGDGNNLNTVQHTVVFGDSNIFKSDEYEGRRDISTSNLRMSEIFVHGLQNNFNYTGGSNYFSRILVSGNANTINGNNVHDSMIMGSQNTLGWFSNGTNGIPQKMSCETIWTLNVTSPTTVEVSDTGYLPTNGTSTRSIYSDYYYYYRGGAVYRESSVPSGSSYTSISGNDFVQGVRNKTLSDKSYYYVNSSVTTGDYDVPELNKVSSGDVYYFYTKYPDGTVKSTSEQNIGTHIFGNINKISPNVMWSGILGTASTISNSLSYGISGIFVQGMNQTVSDGSNIICMGAGNVSSGHGSIAIGNQLISDKWQTVIGKYNKALPGPERTIPKHDENKTYNAGDIVYDSLGSKYYKCTSSVPTVGMMQNSLWTEVNPDSEKALFIVGNGYGESDSSGDWNDETKIHRSNAMEVYADGTVKAHDFVSDNELTLDGQNGVTVVEDLVNSKLVVSLDTDTLNIINFLKNRPQNGTYSIQNTNGVLSWVQIGIAQVPVQSQTV